MEELMIFSFLPELFLISFTIFSILLKFLYNRKIKNSAILLITAAVCLFPVDESIKYSSHFFTYKYSESILKSLFLLSSSILCKFVYDSDSYNKQILAVLSVVGAMFALSSNNFLSLLFSMELSAITIYMFLKKEDLSNKHVLYWIASSAIFIFAIFLMYVFIGSTNFNDIRYAFSYHQPKLSYFILATIFIAFCMKLGSFLLHFGILDSFKNELQDISIIFCVVRISMIFVFYKIIAVAFYHIDISSILLLASCISLFFGCILISSQTNLKKIIAYFLIYNSGIVFLCSSCKTYQSLKSVLYSALSEIISILGIFIVLTNIKKNKNQKLEYISDLNGISSWNPTLAAFITILFLSLFGLSPFVGFYSRLFVCLSLLSKGIIFPSIVYIISFAINLICLGKIIDAIWFKKAETGEYFIISNENVSKVICFISFFTIISIPLANKLINLMRLEVYL